GLRRDGPCPCARDRQEGGQGGAFGRDGARVQQRGGTRRRTQGGPRDEREAAPVGRRAARRPSRSRRGVQGTVVSTRGKEREGHRTLPADQRSPRTLRSLSQRADPLAQTALPASAREAVFASNGTHSSVAV